MTNRDYLNALTNEQFASWCVDEETSILKNGKYEFSSPSPKLESFRLNATKKELVTWLNMQCKDVRINPLLIMIEAKKKGIKTKDYTFSRDEISCIDIVKYEIHTKYVVDDDYIKTEIWYLKDFGKEWWIE